MLLEHIPPRDRPGTPRRVTRTDTMPSTTTERVLAEMTAARQHAEAVLKGLLEAQSACERQLQDENRRDAMKVVTGRSSLENAVMATRRMIESFERQIQELTRASGEGAPENVALSPQIRLVGCAPAMA
jgi:hypothetical protein